MHKQAENNYLAYAHWLDQETFETANWSEEANKQRVIMRGCITKIQILNKLQMVSDLLKKHQYEK